MPKHPRDGAENTAPEKDTGKKGKSGSNTNTTPVVLIREPGHYSGTTAVVTEDAEADPLVSFLESTGLNGDQQRDILSKFRDEDVTVDALKVALDANALTGILAAMGIKFGPIMHIIGAVEKL